MKSINKIPLAILVASIFVPLTSVAQSDANPGQANWTSASGAYWKDSSGHCWRDSSWTPAAATPDCNPELFKKAEAPAPAPKVAEAPPPAPAPAPEPQIVQRPVSFSAQDLFGFNQAELTSGGKEKLDRLVDQLNDARFDTILATGYADQIGNKNYNQKLSEQRANAVRSYLVSKGVPEDRIRAEGKGEADPLAETNDCNMKNRQQLIQCLAPNRRVEVRVNATRDVAVRPPQQ
jgi:OOP family OmpA-OmpF porin